MARQYTHEYWIHDGRYVGKPRHVPGVSSQGAPLQKLEENSQEACQLMMEDEEHES